MWYYCDFCFINIEYTIKIEKKTPCNVSYQRRLLVYNNISKLPKLHILFTLLHNHYIHLKMILDNITNIASRINLITSLFWLTQLHISSLRGWLGYSWLWCWKNYYKLGLVSWSINLIMGLWLNYVIIIIIRGQSAIEIHSLLFIKKYFSAKKSRIQNRCVLICFRLK